MGITTLIESFTNDTPILIPVDQESGEGIASPYPSEINVNMPGTIIKVTVTLNDLSHTFPDDIFLLLVSPNGQSLRLMGDAGGSDEINNVTITFDDDANEPLPDDDQIVSGTYLVSNYPIFPPPAPQEELSIFNGVSPNGTWQLFAFDDAGGDVGVMAGGWTLTITTLL
ncbi:proprotein convertase P-domain-containing protein [Alteribacter aurantiacus]|uniref:proprotein convertase P-domain-containing protein n=1 Tax=Alteribacter aurantiacus TaxID=254410 RepID=UPI00041FD6EF|nr:proprotein convertase P-domain-containing protein [Alteribacter aurantiacus]